MKKVKLKSLIEATRNGQLKWMVQSKDTENGGLFFLLHFEETGSVVVIHFEYVVTDSSARASIDTTRAPELVIDTEEYSNADEGLIELIETLLTVSETEMTNIVKNNLTWIVENSEGS